MKRFLPVVFALTCWILVFLFPATRSKILIDAGWRSSGFSNEQVDSPPFRRVSPQIASLRNRYPQSEAVDILAAETTGSTPDNLTTLRRLHPADPFVVALQIKSAMMGLKTRRQSGPLTNPKLYIIGPPSSEADWLKVVSIAKKGSALAPQNTYFDWIQLYALCAMNRNDEAREVLAVAERKTEYDSFEKTEILNGIESAKLMNDSRVVSPAELLNFGMGRSFNDPEITLETTKQLMESVIADRHAGRNDRALQTAWNLVRLTDIMRRKGYSQHDFSVGSVCQKTAFLSAEIPTRTNFQARPVSSPAGFHTLNGSLYAYAKAVKRFDLLPKLDAVWSDRTKWKQSFTRLTDEDWDGYSLTDAVIAKLFERAQLLVVQVLPSVFWLGVIFGALSLRFRTDVEKPVFFRGALMGVLLLIGALGGDALMTFGSERDVLVEKWREIYITFDLFLWTPSWANRGLAAILLCYGTAQACAWQKQQSIPPIGFVPGLKKLFAEPDDRLARFDFGWLLGLAAHLTISLGALGGLIWFCWNISNQQTYIWVWPVGYLAYSWSKQFVSWRKKPLRRKTLFLSFQIVSGVMLGSFVSMTMVYTASAFLTVPFERRFERNFERAVTTGELPRVKAQLGL